MKKRSLALILALTMSILLLSACGKTGVQDKGEKGETSITVIDQLGRTVEVPKKVEKIVCLHHHTLDILLELGQGDKLVGVLDKWQSLIGDYIVDVYPRLKEIETPGGLNEINIEAVAALNPDVVFFAHQLPEKYILQLEELGIPAIGISLYVADKEQASTVNPELTNPEEAYTEGMKEAIELIGEITDSSETAKELQEYIDKSRELVEKRMEGIDPAQRIRVYIAAEDMNTYGTGKYVGVQMNRAGAKNVAEEIDGYKQVNIEQVTKWNPEVIFVQNRHGNVLEGIKNDTRWGEINAIKNERLLLSPEYVKPWGHPCPESMALGELWLAKTLYPERFKDVDLESMVQDFYKTFYGISYKS